MKALKAIPKDEPYSLWSGNGTRKDRKGNWRSLKRLSELFEVPESLKRLRRNVKELLEFLSGGGLKAGYIAAEFIGVENFPHRRLKAREFGGKL
jgi:hypothetical protein